MASLVDEAVEDRENRQLQVVAEATERATALADALREVGEMSAPSVGRTGRQDGAPRADKRS